MILSRTGILSAIEAGALCIEPFDESRLGNASYTLTLGKELYFPRQAECIDSRTSPEYGCIEMNEDGHILRPGDFLIGRSAEKLRLGPRLAAFLTTRGSMAQIGLDALQSSLFAEPGTDHALALETKNNGPYPIRLFPGIHFAKAVFCWLASPLESAEPTPNFFMRRGIK